MGNIVVLDELTINQIAAGEVIERPANVVKELVENSIDAGATNILIEVKNGGISYIRITDNGKGIEKDDMQLAFERHATSKIRNSDDLLKVTTMGFRGEALASIASIANVELFSCTANNDVGNRIVVKAGETLEFAEFGCPKGTTIIVNDIFFNTPVRYKFLKKDFTEAGYIEDIITRMALIHSEIAFKLISGGKQVISTLGNSEQKEVIYGLFGKEIMNDVVSVDYYYEGMTVTGLVGKPEIARSNRNNQIIFVNKRYVKNKTISAAIDEAYRTLIPNGKFAFAVLNLQIDTQLVDVNVHPTKLEIRFQNESEVFKAVFHSIKQALVGNDLSRIMEQSSEKQEIIKENVLEEIKNNEKTFDEVVKKISNIEHEEIQSKGSIIQEAISNYVYDIPEKKENSVEQVLEAPKLAEEVSLFKDKTEDEKKKEFKYVGTVFDTYNIIEYMGEMYIIDQHAAHERVLYERVKKLYYSEDNLSQMLLIPEVVTLSNKEYDIVKYNMQMFNKAGYVLEDFGVNTYKINGVPYICLDYDIKSLFLDIVDGLQDNRTSSEAVEEKFIATIACKAAVKANMNLQDEQIKALIEQMLELENPFTCPHGRPTVIKMSKYELERKFGRK